MVPSWWMAVELMKGISAWNYLLRKKLCCGSNPEQLIRLSRDFHFLVKMQWVGHASFCCQMFVICIGLLCKKDEVHTYFYMKVYLMFITTGDSGCGIYFF